MLDAANGLASGERDPEGTLQIRMNNVGTDGSLDLIDVIRIPVSSDQISRYCLQAGDVLFNNTNSTELVGKSTLFPGHDEPVLFSNHFTRLRTNRDRLHPSYLARWLTGQQQSQVFAHLCNRWVNQSAVRKEALLGLGIPLPPLSEQKRIAAILDQADAIRRKRRQAGATTAELPTAIFLGMFGDPAGNPKGWPVVPMGQLFASSPNYGTMQQPSNHPGGWLDLRVANIQVGVLDLSDRKYVELEPSMIPRHEVRDGDLLLARAIGSREHLGKCFIAHPGKDRWAFDSHLMRIRLDRARATPEFIQAFLASPGGRYEFLKHTRRSAVQFNVNTKEMAQVEVPLAPIALQQRFVSALAEVSGMQVHLSTGLAEADDLFASLAHQAFRGDF
jgi:type I restriction enzyme S subunit